MNNFETLRNNVMTFSRYSQNVSVFVMLFALLNYKHEKNCFKQNRKMKGNPSRLKQSQAWRPLIINILHKGHNIMEKINKNDNNIRYVKIFSTLKVCINTSM